MTILMTADAVGGVWTYALDLARAVGAAGVEVTLATMGPRPTAAQLDDAASIPTLSVEPSDFRLEWMDDPWEDVGAAGRWLLALEQRLDPDVVHLNGYVHGAWPFRAPVVSVAHSCVASWWEAVHGEPAPHAWDRYRQSVRNGLAGVEAVVAPSAAMAHAVRRLHAPHTPVRVIANGRCADHFRIAAKEPFVLAAGRVWDRAKNVDALVAAAARVSWPVRIAGPGAPEADAGTVEWLGPLSSPALAGWLSRAAIYALPARYEPFGLSVVEAALSGCALVLGDLPSLRQGWDGHAVFVAPDDVDGLAGAIQALIDDPARREALGAAAAARARRVYGLEPFGERYLALYRELIDARASQREDVRPCAS